MYIVVARTRVLLTVKKKKKKYHSFYGINNHITTKHHPERDQTTATKSGPVFL